MAINIADVNVTNRWGNRPTNMFIDYMVQSAALLNRFSLIDGVKSRADVPIFNGTLAFGSDLCLFDPQSTAEIGEKEMTVATKKWDFLNCKNALETAYRSVLLKKGQLNPETMDTQFNQWVYEYFAKLAAAEVMRLSAGTIETEMTADADVIDDVHGYTLAKANILAAIEESYLKCSAIMLSAIYGDADRAFKPAIFLGTVAYRAFELAIADKFTTTPQGIENGGVRTWFGMEVIHWSAMKLDSLIITSPSNLVLLTDNYNDATAINAKYEAEINSDKLWGQFKIGFSYYKGSEIVWGVKA